MIEFVVVLLLAMPPRLHPVPEAVRPYVHRLRGEPEVIRWLLDHRGSERPLTEMIGDGQLPVDVRQRVWQAKRKLRLAR